ncbi:hypothetical protein MJ904_23305 [Massilia sp. MB5]|uniref:hypothetical protein n=1 Tax=Massilia sp. MB5 TaxID=2919578 RepID=UPI001F0D80FD|nr:hypothetical protein [Massilia sp. MB5]UMR29924.1 hypothetical protein MJ904_23305 [Massilia sp. MB5]
MIETGRQPRCRGIACPARFPGGIKPQFRTVQDGLALPAAQAAAALVEQVELPAQALFGRRARIAEAQMQRPRTGLATEEGALSAASNSWWSAAPCRAAAGASKLQASRAANSGLAAPVSRTEIILTVNMSDRSDTIFSSPFVAWSGRAKNGSHWRLIVCCCNARGKFRRIDAQTQ